MGASSDSKFALGPQQLYTACDPALFAFADTTELAEPTFPFGQQRAMQALQLALETRGPGYNVFVLGTPGSGRHAIVRQRLKAHAPGLPAPRDWCYLYNFDEPQKPRVLALPAGEGARLRDAMKAFVDELGTGVQAAFEGEEYRARLQAIQKEYKQREEAALNALGERALAQGVALVHTPAGFAFTPVKDGQPSPPPDFEALPAEQRERVAAAMRALSGELLSWMQELPRQRREMQSRVREASRDTLKLAAGHLIDELRAGFAAHEPVQAFLREVLADLVDSGKDFRAETHEDEDDGEVTELTGALPLVRYQVNLLVGHAAGEHAPVVECDNPTHPQLVGRVEQVAHLGTLITNFTMIRAGALHRANGGYLLLDAVHVLSRPYAWEALKRALRAGRIEIESLPEAMGLGGGSASLEPEPVPLAAKVVLFGEREHYFLLQALDPEFGELFRVAADFEDDVPRSGESAPAFAACVASLARQHGLRPCDAAAVARLVEVAAREAGHAQRLSTRTSVLEELLHEADTHAARAGDPRISRVHVEAALADREHRGDRLRERLQQETLEERLVVETTGAEVGQVNGLAFIDLGAVCFGRALRITATARPGEGKVLDIERESALGQPLHSKGVLILSSCLAARYAASARLSLAASLVFEQSYGAVEGDSASLAELCALLSTLGRVALKQSLAVTGSVDQFGRVQAVGAVNEKVEGFFALCQARGLDGTQGVLVPAANAGNLMLRREVVEAVREGRFQVFAVRTLDEALELLSGMPAGSTDPSGRWTPGSFNDLVARRLEQFAHARQSDRAGQGPRLHRLRHASGPLRDIVPGETSG